MKRMITAGIAVTAFVAVAIGLGQRAAGEAAVEQARQTPARQVPTYTVDPSWPSIPNNWVLGEVSAVAVDAQDHVWILHRPRTVRAEQRSMAAPAVLEYDAAGKFLQAWGGPGEGYDWPGTEHGISIDHKGYVWIGGSGGSDDQILKLTKAGKFVMQIGHSGQSKGNKDTNNVHQPADVFVYPKTNEVFVADGYGNRRVIVFDADTGAFKRMWGAFGNEPTDPAPRPGRGRSAASGQPGQDSAALSAPATPAGPLAQETAGPNAQQFDLVHAARVSNEGLVYVSDRNNRRVQVFTTDGKFVKQLVVSPDFQGPTASRTAFSPDPQQRFLYVIDRSKQQVVAFDRSTFEMLGSFGGPGCPAGPAGPSGCASEPPGTFGILHDIAVDSKSNIYTAEVNQGRRAQKFVFKGMSRASNLR